MTLTERIQKILFEDTWNTYGSEYMSHPMDQQPPITIQPELPITASPHANMQLTDSAPPVDDETYIPTNNKELGSALAILAEKIPDQFVENLYRQFRTAALSAESQGTSGVTMDKEQEEADEAMIADQVSSDEIAERVKRLTASMVESYWGDVKTGSPRKDHSDLGLPEDEDPELDDEGNYIGKRADTIQGKHLAKYYRSKPGVDPDELKGTGESTMVTGSGRTAVNVLGPLFKAIDRGLHRDEIDDAVEYLRMQFKMLAHERGIEKIPAEAPKTFQGMIFKKIIPKMDEGQLDDFLMTVIKDYKRRNKRWLNDMFEKSLAEVESERAAWKAMKADLDKVDPEQSKLMGDIIEIID